MMLLGTPLRAGAVRSVLAFSLVSAACTPQKSKGENDPAPQPAPATPQAETPQGAQPGPNADPNDTEAKKPSAKEARALIEAFPSDDIVQQVVNPRGRKPYDGPTGSIVGVVKATGDPVPPTPHEVEKMEANCTDSKEVFGSLFREGKDRTLADVLVAVTEYEGYVPAKDKYVVVKAKGCAWDRRTVALTFGQALQIEGLDNRPYVPELLGQPMPAQLFVLPTAPPVRIPPQKPGRYTLVDSMRLFNKADVFVVPYPTFDVTDVDGKFEIVGIPAGKVKVNALLPQTMEVAEKEVTIVAGKPTVVNLTVPFDRAKYDKMEKPRPLEERPAP